MNIETPAVDAALESDSQGTGMVNILEASIMLFSRLGYGNVSIKDIAKEAGTSTSLIYHHYADKNDLLRKSICRAVEKFMSDFETEKSKSPECELDVWLHVNAIDNLRLQRLLIMLIDLRGLNGDLYEVSDCINSFYELERRVIRSFLLDGGGRPGQGDCPNLSGLEDLVSICLDGVMVRSMIHEGFDIKAALSNLRGLITNYRGHFLEAG